MRERAELYGGHLSAGPGAQGGWAVRAELPFEDDARLDAIAGPPAQRPLAT